MATGILNLPEWARHVPHNLAVAAERCRDERLAASHDELAGHVPSLGYGPGPSGAVPLRLRGRHGELRLITTVATAADVTLPEPHLEAFPPADQETAPALPRNVP